ncbi:hypothetical protein [Hyunsoonleella ulvae]|uniref:hypothetical protein n=1 Tax=Hyunsoonleella ulvae TaxID=2799948 RepID=UPI0019395434|nr:hypothetical protein [Hyunsoonleella ulvae]
MIKKQKKYLACFGLFLTSVILGLTFFFIIKNKKQESVKHDVAKIEELRSRVLLHSHYSGHVTIPKDNKLKNIKGNLEYFSKVFPESKLVLYISSNQCNSCINDAVNKVETYLKTHPKFKYVIISKGFSLRELKLMQTDRNIGAEIYALTDIELSFFNKMDEVQYPYYFVVNKNLEVSNVFFPIKSSSILEDRYFTKISELY